MESDVREKILETARCIFLKEGYKGTWREHTEAGIHT